MREILPDAAAIRLARRRLHWKAASIFVVFGIGYAGVMLAESNLWRVVWMVVLVHGCLAMATGVMHDANHGSFSSSKRVNALFAWTADWLGASSHLWRHQHNVLHHHHTNVLGKDSDLEQDPFARLAPGQDWRRWHRAQQLYLWPLYGFLQVKWFLFGDWRSLVHADSTQRRSVWWKVALGKAMHASWAIVLPVLVHGWLPTLVVYLVCSWVVGFALAVTFQIAHCVDRAEFVAEGEAQLTGDAMMAHQLATTVDVESRGPLRWYLAWLVGGLDHQVEHHLAPRVPHTAYRRMSARVDEVCADHALERRCHPSALAAIASHWRWLVAMGRRPALG